MHFIDLHFLGHAARDRDGGAPGPSGLTLVDPGPTSCLPALESGLHDAGSGSTDVRTMLLTHIHLDHAGATGTLLARLPAAVAYVHERGAPHMIDPTKLLASATRLYGANMDRFWGEFRPVPADRLRVLSGGERLELARPDATKSRTRPATRRTTSAISMPATGTRIVGDTAGIRVAEGYIKAPTPPPDIDLELWEESLADFRAVAAVVAGADTFRRRRRVAASTCATVPGRARATGAPWFGPRSTSDGTDEERIRRFSEDMRADARRALSEEERSRRRRRRRSISCGWGWRGTGGRKPASESRDIGAGDVAEAEVPVDRPALDCLPRLARSVNSARDRHAAACVGGHRFRRIDQEAQRVAVGRSTATSGAGRRATPPTAPGLSRSRSGTWRQVARAAFELQVHDAVERNRGGVVGLDEGAGLADVAGRDRREPNGSGRVLPGQTGRQGDIVRCGSAAGRLGDDVKRRVVMPSSLSKFRADSACGRAGASNSTDLADL